MEKGPAIKSPARRAERVLVGTNMCRTLFRLSDRSLCVAVGLSHTGMVTSTGRVWFGLITASVNHCDTPFITAEINFP